MTTKQVEVQREATSTVRSAWLQGTRHVALSPKGCYHGQDKQQVQKKELKVLLQSTCADFSGKEISAITQML